MSASRASVPGRLSRSPNSPVASSPPTALRVAQSMTGLEHVAAATSKYKKRARADASSSSSSSSGRFEDDYVVHGNAQNYELNDAARASLSQHAEFFTSNKSISSLLLTILDAEERQAMALHAYETSDWIDAAGSEGFVSDRDVLIYIAQRLFVWVLRVQDSNLSLKEALAKTRESKMKIGSRTAGDIFFGVHRYLELNARLSIPPARAKTTITRNLTSLVGLNGAPIILDERKEKFRGHAACIKVVKGVPCLWTTQTYVEKVSRLKPPHMFLKFQHRSSPELRHPIHLRCLVPQSPR